MNQENSNAIRRVLGSTNQMELIRRFYPEFGGLNKRQSNPSVNVDIYDSLGK